MPVFVAIPVILPFGQPEIINQTHAPKPLARHAAVVEGAPDGLTAAPRKSPGIGLGPIQSRRAQQFIPAGCILAGPVGLRGTVLADHVRNAGIDK